jgi:hypothetical protein
MIRKTYTILTMVLMLGATGCATIQDYAVDLEIEMRNDILAQKGWNEWSWCYDELDQPFHFAKGFKQGYQDILAGGNGCQPTLPPRWYWKPQYQSIDGRSKINAWFDGFSHGALAAQQDGYGNLGEIPMSPTAKSNFIAHDAPVSADIYGAASPLRSPVPDAIPQSGDAGSVSVGDLTVPVPPAVDATELAVPVRPYDD